MNSDLVTIRNLGVELGGNAILRGVSAGLKRGQITALIGLNGSGKTTVLRAILKEVSYTGRIDFQCGHDHRRPNPRHVGYVPQKLRIDANLPLTVRDLLALAMQRRPLFLGVSRHAADTMQKLLQQVRAPQDLLDRPVEKLSGGELQRVLLGLALQPKPELLLLDEPAAGVDFKDQNNFYQLISDINRTTDPPVTILLVSHELNVVTSHAHHVLCLKDGRIQCEGTPRDILTQEVLSQTFGEQRGYYGHDHQYN